MTALVIDRVIVAWTYVCVVASSLPVGYGFGLLWLTSPVGALVAQLAATAGGS